MKILIVAATEPEVQGLVEDWIAKGFRRSETVFQVGNLQVDLLITGPGMLFTGFAMGSHLRQFSYDLSLNIGIAGAIDRELALGDVVHITQERMGDLGAENQDSSFLDLFELKLLDAQQHPFTNGQLNNPESATFEFLPSVNGLTVNQVHGSASSIERMCIKYPEAQVESMEGAAFFYSALLYQIPFLAIRSISNYVEPRNRDRWDIDLALKNLHTVVHQLLETLGSESEAG
ncbi:MAG: futalosine hydrolase [Bacteroidota bacterium]